MLKVGIVGSGFGFYGLLPAFTSIDNCKVVSICGRKTARMEKYCNDVRVGTIYSDWNKMIMNEKLDVIAIAVPPGIQYKIAKKAIELGLHIFAEKPLAENYKQAKELLNLANKKKITHTVDFLFPEIEEWKKVKHLLETKEFGNLIHISVNWDFLSYDIKNKITSWKTNVKKGGGALSFYFSHSLYYLQYFAGEISKVKSIISYSQGRSKNNGRIETGVDVLIKFVRGSTANGHICSNNRGVVKHQLIFKCERGIIVLENENSIVNNFHIKIYNNYGKKKTVIVSNTADQQNIDERVKIVRRLAKRFVEACIYGKQMTPSFADGVHVQKLIENIRKNQIE